VREKERIMDSLRKDVQKLNERVMLLAAEDADSEGTTNRLAIGAGVAKRLRRADAEGYRTAIQCGVPLVVIRGVAMERLMTADAFQLSRAASGCTQAPDGSLADLNALALQLAQRTSLLNPVLSAWWFGLPPEGAAALARASLWDLQFYARECQEIVELRRGADEIFWTRVLIGSVLKGPRGERISQEAATMSLFGGWGEAI
jgi:hypothetical protein